MNTVVSQLRPEHTADLRELFRLCDCGTDPGTYDPDWTLVATVDNRAVGFIAAWVCGQPYVFIDNFLIHPEYRKKGVAVTLGTAMLAILEKRNASKSLVLRCVVTTPELVEPLKKYGFRMVSAAVAMEK